MLVFSQYLSVNEELA